MKKFENDRLNEDIKLNGSRPSINWSKVKVYVAAATLLVGSVAVADDLIDNYINTNSSKQDYSYSDEQNTTVRYTAPSGYTLTYDENGNPICVRKGIKTVEPYVIEVNGETKYYAPAGYTLTQDENGNPVCVQEFIEKAKPIIIETDFNRDVKYPEMDGYTRNGNIYFKTDAMPISLRSGIKTVEPYVIEVNGETKYYAPAGYTLTQDENGKPICVQEFVESVGNTYVSQSIETEQELSR